MILISHADTHFGEAFTRQWYAADSEYGASVYLFME